MLIKLLLSICLASASQTLWAECGKSNVCDDYYDYGDNCQVIDVCSSPLDFPAVNLAPLTPLPSLQLQPQGTTYCDYKQVHGVWQNVCQ